VPIDYKCDDHNLVNGDGCSSECTVEYGFKCDQLANLTSTCSESIKPSFSVSKVTEKNIVFVEFSEYVTIVDEFSLIKENLEISLFTDGIALGENFEYEILSAEGDEANFPYETGDTILKFRIALLNV
jgi:cysteine-rich repeat protein